MTNGMVTYTSDQLAAINSRGKNLLVSASAGSGKTTVMIERIISLMLGEPRVPINNFLVVTFTKASAADMKRKLIEKLFALEADEWILKQIENVHTSDISNLHSFCSRLISVYFYKAQVDPTFHVIDEVEANLLKVKAAEKLFEEKEKTGDENYFKLFEMFQQKRSEDGLINAINKLNNFLNSIIDGKNWFARKIDEVHNLSLSTNICAKLINNYVCSQVAKDIKILEAFAGRAQELGCEKYAAHFYDIASTMAAVKANKYFETNAELIFGMSFKNTPTVSDEFKFLSEEAAAVKKTVKSHIENYKNNFTSSDTREIKSGLEFGKTMLLGLLNLTLEFDEIYSKLKKDANGLDFNDLEKCALEILSDPAICTDVKNRYKYVFVDEYQDINEVQEKLISLVSGTNNRFMVGDIKQSIYRFRFCDPDIFLGTYNRYSTSSEDEVIKLNCNFRSDKKILQFVDMVFAGVMTKEFGGIDYAADSRFVAGDCNLDLPDSVNLCFIDTEKPKVEKQPVSGVYSVKNHIQEDSDEEKKAECEAVYVARKIADLVSIDNPARIKFEDIAILVQSRNETTAKFLQTLSKLGIPISSDEKYDITKQNYIDEIVSFVSLCVNQKDDINLFKVLKSKLFNFSDNELVQIRKLDMKARFFDCINKVELSNNDEFKQKVMEFKNCFDKFKTLSKILNVKDFVKRIVSVFSLKQICLANADGTKRLAELESFEKSLPEVYPFEFVENYKDFSLEMQNESGEDAVKFMSIHASKGIEFKAVFVCNTSKPFANMSLLGDFLLSKELGGGINYFDFDNRQKHRSLPLSAISLIEQRKLVEENQRVLYVALTRAKEKLFVVCSKPKSSVSSKFKERPNSFANWFEPIISDELDGKHHENINFECFTQDELKFEEEKISAQLLLSAKKVKKASPFKYGFEGSVNVPLKNSVSKLLQGNFDKTEFIEFDDEFEAFENASREEYAVSNAERGTAYHKVFENIDLKNINNIDENLAFIMNNILDAQEAKLVDINVVKKVLELPLFKQIEEKDKIIKEREFCANFPAKLISKNAPEEDTFILQGVIDLLIVKDNSLILLDYKTGNETDDKLKKYKFQLDLYADVASRAFGLPVEKKYICFVDFQKIIEI